MFDTRVVVMVVVIIVVVSSSQINNVSDVFYVFLQSALVLYRKRILLRPGNQPGERVLFFLRSLGCER